MWKKNSEYAEYIDKFNELQKKIKYKYKNLEYLKVALTHKSYNGMFGIVKQTNVRNNERLEFLGDSVLGYIVTDYIFKKFHNLKEGELSDIRSHIVCKSALSTVAKKFELHKYLIYGKGLSEQELKINDSMLENTVEAIVGSIYLDGGIKKATSFVREFVLPQDDEIQTKTMKDSKSRLQEILQAGGETHIEYVLVNTTGPDHDKFFEVQVLNNGKKLGSGSGKNKKLAEQNAAKEALISISDEV